MKKMKYLRTWLVAALLVTIIGSLTGGTVAWFTDSVESTGNVIETGTLDVKLYAVDKDDYEGEGTAWTEVTNNSPALFDYKLWEPGYTSVKYVKIENAGNLAFKYSLNVKPAMSPELLNGTQEEFDAATKLAKVIDVYVAPADQYDSFAEIKEAAAMGPYTLYDLAMASLTDTNGAVHGVMLPKGHERPEGANEDYVKIGDSGDLVIALHMQESAGNEYQGLSISDGFVIELRAAQYMYEEDSFGNTYDADATNDLPSAFVQELTNEQLNSATVIDFAGNPVDTDLEAGYLFATTDAEVTEDHPYFLWHADFVVSFDKEVKPSTIGLAGQYTFWNENWIAIPLDSNCINILANKGVLPTNSTIIPANTDIRLLKYGADIMVGMDYPIYKNYDELCREVVQFLCGVYQIGEGVSEPTTMTVKMNLYEVLDPEETNGDSNVETGKYITVGQFEYEFK